MGYTFIPINIHPVYIIYQDNYVNLYKNNKLKKKRKKKIILGEIPLLYFVLLTRPLLGYQMLDTNSALRKPAVKVQTSNDPMISYRFHKRMHSLVSLAYGCLFVSF